jgi:hypothetical protein
MRLSYERKFTSVRGRIPFLHITPSFLGDMKTAAEQNPSISTEQIHVSRLPTLPGLPAEPELGPHVEYPDNFSCVLDSGQ